MIKVNESRCFKWRTARRWLLNPRFFCPLRKVSIAIIVVQRDAIFREPRHKQIGVTIVIVVARDCRETTFTLASCQSRSGRNIRELSTVITQQSLLSRSVKDVQVSIAVAVKEHNRLVSCSGLDRGNIGARGLAITSAGVLRQCSLSDISESYVRRSGVDQAGFGSGGHHRLRIMP